MLRRVGQPVFVSRPMPSLFDGIDPSTDKVSGTASYSIQVERECFFRQVSLRDRRDIDFANNTSNAKMKWRRIPGGQPITWEPLPITRTDMTATNVSTFDIAVISKKKVVVFRNAGRIRGRCRHPRPTRKGRFPD